MKFAELLKLTSLHLKIKVRIKIRMPVYEDGVDSGETRIVETTTGRALLSEILPTKLDFEFDRSTDEKENHISELINVSYREAGLKDTVIFADQLMYTGFKWAALAGVSIGVDDMVTPDSKVKILDQAAKGSC